ncbi:Hypothetical protein Cul05146_1361 [Corynebacterium ulcerans]|uniref:Uncharacterized protein n=1 Tax=Corynebacterium ulcerans FRC58 TaxID=1408268 RepID=A0ABN4GUC2_CORUL|nr:Hypothetical protein Cul05146_1361 [Corynebacterium ulcerans]AKN77215.1 Hypothetical protein CulFRC58_1361 [Corynebacterium ulcerans FRC58]
MRVSGSVVFSTEHNNGVEQPFLCVLSTTDRVSFLFHAEHFSRVPVLL